MVRFSNGFYSFSDSYFKSMRKQDLINYIRTIEKNWENALITNNIQYENCKRLLVEERAKAIDEFAEEMKWEYRESIGTSEREIHFALAVIDQVAERLKGVQDE